MKILKALILFTIVLITVLVAVIYFAYDERFDLKLAREEFLKGEYAKSIKLIEHIQGDIDPSCFHLYKSYNIRELHQLEQADAELALAKDTLSKDNTSLAAEIYLNELLNCYLAENKVQLHSMVTSLNNEYSTYPFVNSFQAFDLYQEKRYEESLSLLGVSSEKEELPWWEGACSNRFDSQWRLLLQARCLIGMQKFLAARELLEERRDEFEKSNLTQVIFLIGFTYMKEAQEKPLAAALPYCRLAQSYFEKVPIQQESFSNEKQAIIQEWEQLANQAIAQCVFDQLSLFTELLETWKAEPALERLSEQVLVYTDKIVSQKELPAIYTFSQTLNNSLQMGSFRRILSNGIEKRFETLLADGNFHGLYYYWKIGKWFIPHPQEKMQMLSSLLESLILKEISNDNDSLDSCQHYFTFWDSVQNNKEKRSSFSLELFHQAEPLWKNADTENKAFSLTKVSTSLLFLQERENFQHIVAQKLEIICREIQLQRPISQTLKNALEYFHVPYYPDIKITTPQNTVEIKTTTFPTLNTEQRLKRGVTYLAQKNYKEARKEFDIVIQSTDDFALKMRTMPLIARTYAKINLWDEAIAWYNSYLQLSPDDFVIREQFAELYEMMERWDLVLNQYDLIRQKQALIPEQELKSINALWHLGRRAQARSCLSQLFPKANLGNLSIATTILLANVALELDHHNLLNSALRNLAGSDIQDLDLLGDYALVIVKSNRHELFHDFLEENPSRLEWSASGCYALACYYLQHSLKEKAVEAAVRGHIIATNNIFLHDFILRYDDNLERAIDTKQRLEKTTSFAENHPYIRYLRAMLMLKEAVALHNNDNKVEYHAQLQAIQDILKDVMKKIPYYPALYSAFAQTHYLLGNESAALEGLRYVLNLNPSSKDAYKFTALIQKDQGLYPLAEKTLQTALNYFPKDMELLLFLADVYVTQNKQKQLKDTLMNIITEHPHHQVGYIALAKSLIQDKQYQEAEYYLNVAYKIEPKNPECLRLLILCIDSEIGHSSGNQETIFYEKRKAILDELDAISPETAAPFKLSTENSFS